MEYRPKTELEASPLSFTLVFAILISIGIRFCWITVDCGSLQNDPDAYKALAEGYATSGTFGRIGLDGVVQATAYRPPAYVWLLSWFVVDSKLNDLAVGILHGVLGGLTCGLVARIAFLLSSSTWIAVVACVGVAIDPILLKQSSQVMTETLATLVGVSLWWGWIELNAKPRSAKQYRVWMMILGLVAGAGCLVRPTTLVWIALWIGLTAGFAVQSYLQNRSSSTSSHIEKTLGPYQSLHAWLFFLLGMACVVTPWAYRNAIQIGQWTMTTTHGGYTILLANNPVLYDNIRNHGWDRKWDEEKFHHLWAQRSAQDPRDLAYWQRSPQEVLSDLSQPNTVFRFGTNGEHREVSDDRLASQVAWKTISSDPTTFIRSCFVRLSWFWAVTPYRAGVTGTSWLAIGAWYTLLYLAIILSLVSIVRDGSSRKMLSSRMLWWIPAIALVVSLTLVHAIYWSNMRMRAPLMPALYVFALVSFLPRHRSLK